MITKLTLKNFKNVEEQIYDFTRFDLVIGPNNSGKSTMLQALAIWQYCIDEFQRSSRAGSKGIQIVLPNFTALPVPEFSLLWRNKTDRHWPINEQTKVKKQEYILIEIELEWQTDALTQHSFGIELRYHSPQTIYAIPKQGWKELRDLFDGGVVPKIAYVPPFSGLEPAEKWMDVSPIRQHIGKGQPGGVLRNLLLQAYNPTKAQVTKSYSPPKDWYDLVDFVNKCFSIDLMTPVYDSQKDVYIKVEYKKGKNTFDIISGGSGFHQTLTLLAFIYGYKATTVLLDEPDAHMHVNLQRRILDYLKDISNKSGTQFLTATHAEEFARGVNPGLFSSQYSPGIARTRPMSRAAHQRAFLMLSHPAFLSKL